MSMIQSDLLLGQEGGAGYTISRSLRFNSSDSAYLSRTPASAGNRKTWTWAGWVKRSTLSGGRNTLFAGHTGSAGNYNTIEFVDSTIYFWYGGGSFSLQTAAKFRDVGAWMHVCVALDTTQATASNRVKIYVNGVQQAIATGTYPTQNTDLQINAASQHDIGMDGGYDYFSGYLADIHFIDGQALTPSSFTEVSATTGQLIPKAYTGSFGTNGFWLKFSDNSAATATTLGKDYSGNNNNWTPNNLVTYLGGITTGSLGGTYGGGASGSFANVLDQTTATGWGGVVNSNGQTVNVTLNFSGVSGVTSLRVFAYFRSGQSGQVSVNGGSYTGYTVGSNVGWVDATSQLSGSTTLTSLTWRMTHAIGGTETPLIYAVEVNGSIIGSASSSDIDSLVDTPTSYGTDAGNGGEVRGNYSTWNPLFLGSGYTLSNGNLDITGTAANNIGSINTIAMQSGKWYWEVTVNNIGSSPADWDVGIVNNTVTTSEATVGVSSGFSWRSNGGFRQGAATVNISGVSYTTGDVLSFAFDSSTLNFWIGKNGSWLASGNPATGSNPAGSMNSANHFFVGIRPYGSSASASANFGQRPFAYPAPSGFKALCDTNLPAPVVAKSSTVMDVKLYTGNGSTQTISGLGFSPDWIWLKARNDNSTYTHVLTDSNRGSTKILHSNLTEAEGTSSNAIAYTSDGFTVLHGNSGGYNVNVSGNTYVAWAFDAGNTTTTNTAGSITSQVRANPSAGFSIVTWTASGSSTQTVGHGLGIAPALIITKSRTDGTTYNDWMVYHSSLAASNNLRLNSTSAAATFPTYGRIGAPTSSVITLTAGSSSNFNVNSGNMVAYAFSPVAGYSSFGSYTGNGSADGPFVYTGFRPRWVMVKLSSAAGENWVIIDAARSDFNLADEILWANLSNAELGNYGSGFDFTANGFKIRGTWSGNNTSAATYVWAAFAESPFAYSRAR